MSLNRRLLVTAATALALAPAAWAQTAMEVGGVKYEPTATVAGTKLQLNGAGVRYKAIFKVYTAGLYVANKTAEPDAIINSNGPRRMHIVMLREIDANELGKLFTKGMQDNASRDDFSKSIPGTIKMGEIFAERKKLKEKDFFTIDYVPGVGTTISINGKAANDPIKEPEFFKALMQIWLGGKPADGPLKDALLGKPSTANGQS